MAAGAWTAWHAHASCSCSSRGRYTWLTGQATHHAGASSRLLPLQWLDACLSQPVVLCVPPFVALFSGSAITAHSATRPCCRSACLRQVSGRLCAGVLHWHGDELLVWPCGVLLRCRGLLDGAFPTDRAVVYTFGLALPSGHIPSTPKLQQALRILEMRQLLQHARSKAGAAAAAEQSQAAAAANEQSQAAAIAKSTLASVDALCALVEANTAVAGAGPFTFGGSHDVVFTPGKRTVATRRSARLAKNN